MSLEEWEPWVSVGPGPGKFELRRTNRRNASGSWAPGSEALRPYQRSWATKLETETEDPQTM